MPSAALANEHLLGEQNAPTSYVIAFAAPRQLALSSAADCRSPVQAAEFVRAKLWDTDTKRLRRSFRVGPSAAQGFADDYAYMIAGLLDLYQVSI